MNENREYTAHEAADAPAGAGADKARDALFDGLAEDQDGMFETVETDSAGTDLFGTDLDGDDPYGGDDLILEAEPGDGADGAGGASGLGGTGGTDNAAGNSGQNAAGGADAATDGAAGKEADKTALPGEEPKYKVQMYGREQELTVPQLVAAAEKGLDYDNVCAQLAAAQQALPALRMVEQYAAANGMTAQQYLQAAGQDIQQQAVNELTQKGVPEQTARELVAERMKLEEERRAIAPLMQRLNAEEARKKARDPWLAVTREYPDVVNLPESVLLSVQKGETPLAAMRAWELEQLRAKLSAQEMQISAQAATLKNRQTAPGSAAGAADTRRDPFLDALFSTD